ncbi:MAG: Hint domain-containing protein [Paracoccaceae bacterium]|nr:Hint domain-containing protein [Paracoccaceae bacterium]
MNDLAELAITNESVFDPAKDSFTSRVKPPKRPWSKPTPVAPKDKPAQTSCLPELALMQTPDGIRTLDELYAGDKLLTKDGRAVTIRWMGTGYVRPAAFPMNSLCDDIIIPKNSLGLGLPLMDLQIPGNQLVQLSEDQIVQAASLKKQRAFVQEAWENNLRPIHVHLEQDELVNANGVWVKLLRRCPDPRISLSLRQREEIASLYTGFVG